MSEGREIPCRSYKNMSVFLIVHFVGVSKVGFLLCGGGEALQLVELRR